MIKTNTFSKKTDSGKPWLTMILFTIISMLFSQVSAQTVSGIVTEGDTGEPLPGVNIVLKGTISGTVTDVNGAYTLNAVSTDILVYSSVGYLTQEITVGTQSSINVSLQLNVTALEELVVVGYTSQSKQRITGAMSQVNTEEALSIPIINAGQALQGRASGVHVVGGGQPGSTPLIRIRGFGTTNDNGPLFIIDGMQTTDASVLGQINPLDIEAINVLKDASAAIYGARASNGVVIVTTKRGKHNEKPTITFSSYVGVQQVGKTQDLLDSQQLGQVIFDSFRNDGVTPDHPQYGSGESPVIPEFIRGTDAQPYDAVNNKTTRASQGTDWLDEIFQSAMTQNYDLSVLGGGQKSRFMMSAGYQNIEGIQIYTGFERFSSRLNAEFDVNDNIRIGEHMSFAYTDQLNQNELGLAQATPPLVPVFDEGGNFAGSGPSTASGLSNTNNPVAELTRGKDNFNRNLRLIGDAYMEINFLKDFTAKTSIGINYNQGHSNTITRLNPEAPEPRATNTLRDANTINSSWVWTNTLNWSKEVGNHSINVLGGIEALSETSRLTDVGRRDFLLENADFFLLGAGTGTPFIQSNNFDKSTLFSYFVSADYVFKQKYLATFSIRRDKTSRFSDGFNTGVFPSGSLGWILSEESFLANTNVISLLKVRASFGLLGNQDVPRSNPYINLLELQQEVGSYPIGGSSVSTGAILRTLGTPSLQWETAKQINFGIDLGLFNDDLSFSIDIFNNTTQDMIILDPLPSTAIDAEAAFINTGEVSNKGFDIGINYSNASKASELKWNIGFNISRYKNELVTINDDNPNAFLNGSVFRSGIITRSSPGLPISYYYGREVTGIFQNEAEVAAAADQGFGTPADGVGRFRYRDIDGNGIINDDDRTNLGNPHPDFTFGFNGNANYKNFFLTFFLQGVQGNEVYHFTKIGTDFPSFLNSNRSTRVLDSWTEANPDAALPALSTSITNNESQPNSYFVEDGSYIRLRNLQVGYNFNVPNLGINNARIYLQATNLFTITDYQGADPEMGTGNAGDDPNPPAADLTIGVDTGRFPISKSYLLGLNFSF